MGHKMKRSPVVFLISFLLVSLTIRVPSSLAQPSNGSKPVQAIIGCLAAKGFVLRDLDQIGLKLGDPVWIRLYIGSIPGMMPTPDQYYVAVYSKDETEAWLLMADRDSSGSVVPIRNAYRLKKNGVHWVADEGNGGLATYKVMSRFATRLFQSHRYRAKLVTGNCAIETNP